MVGEQDYLPGGAGLGFGGRHGLIKLGNGAGDRARPPAFLPQGHLRLRLFPALDDPHQGHVWMEQKSQGTPNTLQGLGVAMHVAEFKVQRSDHPHIHLSDSAAAAAVVGSARADK